VGLIRDTAWEDFQAKQDRLEKLKLLLEKTRLTAAMLEQISGVASELRGTGALVEFSSATAGQALAQLLKRPEITIEQLVPTLRELDPAFFDRKETSRNQHESATMLSSEIRMELKSVETEIKYEGYLLQQQRAMDRLKKAEQHTIPDWFDYGSISGLSKEMQEKLIRVQPRTLGQASRIPGVTPAAVSLVNVFIEIQARRREQAAAL
jgi:tRNA uridine 5-carboxymethylaminomethyl modification enzyme